MTGLFLSALRYDWCTPLSHPSSCMLVNHGSSQQSCKEEYKPWKWGATSRYYASHAKTMLPARKSMPRSSRQWGHMKTWPFKEMQTAVVWKCLLFIKSGQNHLARLRDRRQGRRRKRWKDSIREWTGLEFAKSQRAVENREKWRKLIVKLSVGPQRPSRLRDWWWWWKPQRKNAGGRKSEQHPYHPHPKPSFVQSAVGDAHQESISTATNEHAKIDHQPSQQSSSARNEPSYESPV